MSQGFGAKMTVRDRVLVHLSDYPLSEDEVQVPAQVTQAGLAAGVGIEQKHVPQYVRPLISQGLVAEKTSHVRGGKQRKKAYLLTPQGRDEASRIRGNLLSSTVEVVDPEGGRREMALSLAARGQLKGVPLMEIVYLLESQGFLRLRSEAGPGKQPPGSGSLQWNLDRAADQERQHDWKGAIGSYRIALSFVPGGDAMARGNVHERLGRALYWSARQAETAMESRRSVEEAAASYGSALEAYGGLVGSQPKVFRCRAMAALLRYWLAPGAVEKRALLGEAAELTRQALQALQKAGDGGEYARTFQELWLVFYLACWYEEESQARMGLMAEAAGFGDQALVYLLTTREPEERASLGATLAVLGARLSLGGDPGPEAEAMSSRAKKQWEEAYSLSREGSLLGLVSTPGGALLWGDGSEESLRILGEALEAARRAGDRLLVGIALDGLAYHTAWKHEAVEDPDEIGRLLAQALAYAQEAQANFSVPGFQNPRRGSYCVHSSIEHYIELASHEPAVQKKRELLEKALQAAPAELSGVRETGYPGVLSGFLGTVTEAYIRLAKLEPRPESKRALLNEALGYSREGLAITQQNEGPTAWNLGWMHDHLAEIASEMSKLAEGDEAGRQLLEAIRHKEECIRLYRLYLDASEGRGGEVSGWTPLGAATAEHADLLQRLHGLTGEGRALLMAAEAYEEASKNFHRGQVESRRAECLWKAARAYGDMEKHWRASELYSQASQSFRTAAERIPQLKALYDDHSLYMQAWSEIEKARHHHTRQEYGLASEYYDRTATLHRFSNKWAFIAPNYAAWVQVERAEDMSRRDRGAEAIQAFEAAARLFIEAKGPLRAELPRLQGPDEKGMVNELIRAADRRLQYCRARVLLEEAGRLDRAGDPYGSRDKYAAAAAAFGELAGVAESDQDRLDLKLISALARAWEMMSSAEASASPDTYGEASRLFEEAQALGRNDRAKLLTLGHSRFCRALESGARFSETGDPMQHGNAVQYLEMAANYYLRAGLEGASEYAKATKLLLDAYAYSSKGVREEDQERRMKYYMMAEKVLEASAVSFSKAGYSGKREQVDRLLAKVREERELAASLTEVMQAPSVLATTATFSSPEPSYERAVGLERFEHADVQANIVAPRRELRVEEDFPLEIEMVNAGRSPAQLIKVEEVIPEGFDLVTAPVACSLEDGYLDMKGRRLDPLKTHELKLVLRPKVRNHITLRPRVFYLDEVGRYRSHQPEPVEIWVRD